MITLRTIRRRNRDYLSHFTLQSLVDRLQLFVDDYRDDPAETLAVEAVMTELKRRVTKAGYNAVILKINENYWPAKRGK